MDIQAAEAALVTKLDALSGVKVLAYPDDPDTYKFTGSNAAFLVRYSGSTYADPENEAIRGKRVNQERLLEWVISIIYRNLSSHKKQNSSIYTHIENIRDSLSGYTINSLAHAGVMYPVRDGFVDRDARTKLWEYEIVFRHTFPESEAFQ